MEQNKKTWSDVPKDIAETIKSNHFAMEVLKQEQAKSKMLIIGLTAGLVISGISTVTTTICSKTERENLVRTNYENDCEWRKLFSEYDYISQDGNGENYYNSNVSGEVNNGTASEK